MAECTLHNLLTSCQYPQVFFIYRTNDYDQNVLLAYGTKQEMLEDEELSFDLLDHINDVVDYWTIREDGAMFVRLRMDEKAVEDQYQENYVKKWDRHKPHTRPYLFSAELDDFTHTIHGMSGYMHPYGDPNECHHYAEALDYASKLIDAPSAEPEIVRCGQCKYAEVADEEDAQDGYTCQFHRGSVWFSGSYCSWAERRTDE